jgi:parvulin-like peptidyl-prolyl isomerase
MQLFLMLKIIILYFIVFASKTAWPMDLEESRLIPSRETREIGSEAASLDTVQSGVVTTTPQMETVVMARIGDNTITVEEFMHFLAKNPHRVKEAMTVEGKAELLRVAIENRLLLAAMRQEGWIDDRSDTGKLQMAYTKLEQKHFPRPPMPGEKAMKAYYEEHMDDFGIPSAVRLTQIQFRVPKSATKEDIANAKSRAENAFNRIKNGESFADVAEELTENKRAKPHKGDVGYVVKKGNIWLENALNGLTIGQHTQILESPAGFEILMITDISDPIHTSFEDAKEVVAMRMQDEAQAIAKAAYVKYLASKIPISIELDELKDAYPNGIFP